MFELDKDDRLWKKTRGKYSCRIQLYYKYEVMVQSEAKIDET